MCAQQDQRLVSVYSLSEYCNYGYDSSVLKSKALLHATATTTLNNPYKFFIKNDEQFTTLCNLADKEAKTDAEQKLELKATEKWIYPQGGRLSDVEKEEALMKYLKLPTTSEDEIVTLLYRAATTLKNTLKTKHKCLRCMTLSKAKDLYNSLHFTGNSAGMSMIGKKTKENFARAIRVSRDNGILNYEPVIVSGFTKDSKGRIIFQDSYANFITESKYYALVQEDIYNLPSNAHYDDYTTASIIAYTNADWSYNADYDKMDTNIQVPLMRAGIRLAGYVFSYTNESTQACMTMIENLHKTPIICGKKILVPEYWWSLLSGILPTHELETFISLLCQIESGLRVGLEYVPFGKKLKKGQFTLLVCGDDSTFLASAPIEAATLVKKFHIEIAKQCGMIISEEKTDVTENEIFFCKKMYALRINKTLAYKMLDGKVIPKYSIKKALNAIYHPVNIPKEFSNVDHLYWFCSVLDSAFGMSGWKLVVSALYEMNREFFQSIDIKNYIKVEISDQMKSYYSSEYWLNYISEKLVSSSHTLGYLMSRLLRDRLGS